MHWFPDALLFSKLAYKRGYGPDAVAEQIKRVTFGGSLRRAAGGEVADEVNMVDWYVAGGEEAKLRSACQKLARYAECVVCILLVPNILLISYKGRTLSKSACVR